MDPLTLSHVFAADMATRASTDRTHKPVKLTRKSVEGIQLQGGTILGTSRGGADIRCAPAYPLPPLIDFASEASASVSCPESGAQQSPQSLSFIIEGFKIFCKRTA